MVKSKSGETARHCGYRRLFWRKAELKENDKVEIEVREGTLIIKPLKKRKTLEERIAEYQGEYQCEEWDTGKPMGNEEL